jgi:hypothetical protein
MAAVLRRPAVERRAKGQAGEPTALGDVRREHHAAGSAGLVGAGLAQGLQEVRWRALVPSRKTELCGLATSEFLRKLRCW